MNTSEFIPENIWKASFPLRCFWYLVTPEETQFEKQEDVPDVISQIIPVFVTFIFIEAVICQFK